MLKALKRWRCLIQKRKNRKQAVPRVFVLSNEEERRIFAEWILDITSETAEVSDAGKSPASQYDIMMHILSASEVVTVVLEEQYVDRVYRDSYYSYFSAKHFNYNRFCTRLCLFRGELENSFFDCTSDYLNERFIGSVVIRPLKNKIGRCLLSPKYYLGPDNYYVRTAKYRLTFLGKRLKVKAFPYMTQDGETITCTEVTILNISDYFSQTYQEYRYLLPSDLNKSAEKLIYQRRMPSTGMPYYLVSRVLSDFGYYPTMLTSSNAKKESIIYSLKYFIESGIPVAVGASNITSHHSIIAIGHKEGDKEGKEYIEEAKFNNKGTGIFILDTADLIDDYVFMDDCNVPYKVMKVYDASKDNGYSSKQLDNGRAKIIVSDPDNPHDIDFLIFPLSKRMIMQATDVKVIFTNILVGGAFSLALSSYYESIKYGTRENPIVVRIFIASSRTFLHKRDEILSVDNKEMRNIYDNLTSPKFIWVCELSTLELMKENKIIGEIVLDATSTKVSVPDVAILINYFNVIFKFNPSESTFETVTKSIDISYPKPFDSFRANLLKLPD